MKLDKVLCDKLEKVLIRTEVPFIRKTDLYHNPNRIRWLKDNFKVRNSEHPRYAEIMSLITQILGE
jgi:hypothetical protein